MLVCVFRLAVAADRLDAELRRDNKHTGLVHGDFKSANLFENPETGEWSVVDWQWVRAIFSTPLPCDRERASAVCD